MSSATRQILFLSAVAIFVCVIVIILFYGSGYRINWHNGAISETSDISVNALPATAVITLQSGDVSKVAPARFTQLTPGSYQITVALAGYTSQTLSINLAEQLAVQFDPVQLWPVKPKVTQKNIEPGGLAKAPPTTMYNNETATLYKNPRFKQWLLHQTNTLYLYDPTADTTATLVRLAEPITAVAWHPNGWYVLYSTATQLHIMDSRIEYTSSNVTLVNAPNIETIHCAKNGRTCTYLSNDQTYELELR